MLGGAKLVGGNPENDRVALDYYATNPKAVTLLLSNHTFKGDKILEPCVGEGHIARVLETYFKTSVDCVDIVDRGYKNTIVSDFLTWKATNLYDTIITNPPYSLAHEFIEKCMRLLDDDGQLAMFLRIQFLEGVDRRKLFKRYPPKYIYVFSKRMPTFNNGNEYDPKTGKPWATTLCNAWFVWQKGSEDEPTVRWLVEGTDDGKNKLF